MLKLRSPRETEETSLSTSYMLNKGCYHHRHHHHHCRQLSFIHEAADFSLCNQQIFTEHPRHPACCIGATKSPSSGTRLWFSSLAPQQMLLLLCQPPKQAPITLCLLFPGTCVQARSRHLTEHTPHGRRLEQIWFGAALPVSPDAQSPGLRESCC